MYPCSVIVFNAVDVFSNTINGYAFEVKQGACNNTVYNPERFTQILNTPSNLRKNISHVNTLHSMLLYLLSLFLQGMPKS